MAPKESEMLTFHNESVLLQVARWSKVTGWIVLAIYLLSFINELMQTIPNLANFPPELMNKMLIVANLFFPLVMGMFYWLVMHGLAQGLYVALDLFVTTEEDEEGSAA